MPNTLTPNTHTHNNSNSAIRAYLGGSFNPVHNGHIQMAMQVYNSLTPLASKQQRALYVSLLPNARSPFKSQTTEPKHRLAMLKLAIQNTPLHINELELWQAPPVYTVDSVRSLRENHPNDTLIFIMGMDSARSLEKWKEGLTLTNYVHLWIFNRKTTADNLPKISFNHPNTHQQNLAKNIQQNMNQHNPSVQKLNAQNIATLATNLPYALITQITDSLQHLLTLPHQPLKNTLKDRIYIDSHLIALISSTTLRQQLQTDKTNPNKPLKCLNPAVYQYIITHQLYSAAQFR